MVNINMTNPNETCPSSLTLYMANRTRICGLNGTRYIITILLSSSPPSTTSHVCGYRAVGFSYHRPCAFATSQPGHSWSQTLDGAYVSGLSITHGAPGSRTHIWTYAGGYQESISHGCNCPCAKIPGQSPPSYVGEHYYCESATQYDPPAHWNTNNTLLDNEDCYPGSNCCNTPRAPWFVRDLNTTTSDDLEIRWCTQRGLDYDRVSTEEVEIYVY